MSVAILAQALSFEVATEHTKSVHCLFPLLSGALISHLCVVMPSRRSAYNTSPGNWTQAQERRALRDRWYTTAHSGPGKRFVEVEVEDALQVKLMARGRTLHRLRDDLNTFHSNNARCAAIHAWHLGHTSEDTFRADQRIFQRANEAKHGTRIHQHPHQHAPTTSKSVASTTAVRSFPNVEHVFRSIAPNASLNSGYGLKLQCPRHDTPAAGPSEEFSDVLATLGLESFLLVLLQEGLDNIGVLSELTVQDMRVLGFGIGHEIKLCKWIREQRPNSTATNERCAPSSFGVHQAACLHGPLCGYKTLGTCWYAHDDGSHTESHSAPAPAGSDPDGPFGGLSSEASDSHSLVLEVLPYTPKEVRCLSDIFGPAAASQSNPSLSEFWAMAQAVKRRIPHITARNSPILAICNSPWWEPLDVASRVLTSTGQTPRATVTAPGGLETEALTSTGRTLVATGSEVLSSTPPGSA